MLSITHNPRPTRRVRLAVAVTLTGATLNFVTPFVPALTPSAVAAATFIVNSTADLPDAAPGNGACADSGGSCTLRAAIQEANALGGPDRIEVPAGAFAVSTTALTINSDIELRGAGPTSTSLNLGGTSGLQVLAPPSVLLNVTIAGLTISGGNAQAGGGMYIGDSASPAGNATVAIEDVVLRNNVGFTGGGGIAIGAGKRVTMRRVTIDQNSSTGAFGGGIWNTGTLIIDDSTISRNTANRAGGIHTGASAALVLRNVTVSGNNATSPQSGTGGIVNLGFTNLISTTITNNQGVGSTTTNLIGGGIYSLPTAILAAKNSVIAGNRNSTTPGGPASGPQDCVGAFSADTRFMLVQDTTACGVPSFQQGFLTGVSANLGPLQNNGGPTETHLPNAGSPLIDAGSPYPNGSAPADACPANDQRGITRLVCDLGSTEVEVVVPTTLVVASPADEIDVVPGDGTCATASGVCSLRAAVMESNRLPGLQTISVQPGNYGLTIPPNEGVFEPASGGDLDVSDPLAIIGSGGAATTIIDGNGTSRVFEGTYGVAMSFSQLTIRGGLDSGFGGGISAGYDSALSLTDVVLRNNTATYGGGLHSSGGTVRITRSHITENSTTFGSGGGASVDGALTLLDSRVDLNRANSSGGGIQAGQATIARSTIADNQTLAGLGWGGGVSTGSLRMTNSTVSNNSSVLQGGGIFMSGGTITNSTVTGNQTGTDGGGVSTNGQSKLTHVTVVANHSATGQGHGLMAFGSTSGFGIQNSIIYNSAKGGGIDCVGVAAQRSFGTVVADTSCNLVGATVGNPLLSPLGSYGGPTQTHVPQPGSPAIDLGAVRYVKTDQRGVARPTGGGQDAGSVELGAKGKLLPADSDKQTDSDKPVDSVDPSESV